MCALGDLDRGAISMYGRTNDLSDRVCTIYHLKADFAYWIFMCEVVQTCKACRVMNTIDSQDSESLDCYGFLQGFGGCA